RDAGEKEFRQSASNRIDQYRSCNKRGADVADSWHEIDERIKAEAEFRPRNSQQTIHDDSEPFEEWLDGLRPATAESILRRENFPLWDFRFSIRSTIAQDRFFDFRL